jgi:hypothetical protein
MTNEETLALWAKCEEARNKALEAGQSSNAAHQAAQGIWNHWASKLIQARIQLQASHCLRLTKFDYETKDYVAPETRGANEETVEWLDLARVDFHGARFKDRPYFKGFIFPGQAFFGESRKYTRHSNKRPEKPSVIFHDGANFDNAKFHLDAVFDWAEFKASAVFRNVEFLDIVRFDQCIFEGTVWFVSAKFHSDAWMGQTKLKGYSDFTASGFSKQCSYSGMQSGGSFILNGATFQEMPDFTQSSFQGVPRIDSAVFPQLPFFPFLAREQASEVQARYRAIRQLAQAGQDYENESKALKGEIRARRGTIDRPWHAAYWFGMAYDSLSNVGRSIARPLYLWAASVIIFAAIYLIEGGVLAKWRSVCSDGTSYWLKTLYLSAKTALPIIGSVRPDEARSISNCLYSLQGDSIQLFPPLAAFLQVGQTLLSTILIFLFLLAVRNQFKIK